MEANVQEIGQLLKAKREEMKFSLKEVESSTSIRSSYLNAIEEGLNDKFLSNVYMFGFIRQYAAFLEMDQGELERTYPQVFSATEKNKSSFDYGIGTLEARGNLAGGVKWLANALKAGGVVVGLILFWYLCKITGLI